LDIRKAVLAPTIKLQDADRKKFENIRNTARYEMMSLVGVREATIERSKLVDMVARLNVEIEKANKQERKMAEQEERSLDFSLKRLDVEKLINGETDDLIGAFVKVNGQQKAALEIEKQRLKVLKAMRAEAQEFANELQSAMSDVFKGVLLGEEEMGTMIQRIGDSMREIMAGAVADSFSKAITTSGIGEAFGGMGTALANMFQGPEAAMKDAIITGGELAAPKFREQIVEAATFHGNYVKEKIIEGAIEGEARKKGVLPPPSGPGGGATGIPTSVRLPTEFPAGVGLGRHITDPTGFLEETYIPAGKEFYKDVDSSGRTFNKEVTNAATAMSQSVVRLENANTALARNLISAQAGGGAQYGTAGVFGGQGMFGALGTVMPWLGRPIGGVKPGMTRDPKTGRYTTAKGAPAPSYGQMFGGMVTAATTGYSQYQSMVGRGKDPMVSGVSAGMMGLGSLWMMGGAMAGPAGAPAMILGALMVVGGMLVDAFTDAGDTTKTTIETRTQTKQVTSRIDHTNKQLELVNRNLLALKDELTYIMQQSFYFRERDVEDRFAIDAQRGNM